MTLGGHLSVTDQSVKKIEWKIERFFCLPKSSDYRLDSPFFSFSDDKWYLQFLPNGENRDNPKWIKLYLMRVNGRQPVTVSFTLGIRRANGSILKSLHCIRQEFKVGMRIGYGTKLIRISEFLSLRDVADDDGTLRVFCSALMDDGQPALPKSLSQTDVALSYDIKQLFRSQYEGDITIRVGDKKFLGHKAILAARSSVFRAMFETNMAEKNDGVINIEDCEPDDFEDFLLFLYGGRFDVVKPNSALKLCLIADKYNVGQLKEACFEMMKKEISAESVCDVVYLATLLDDEELLKTAAVYFFENMEEIISTPKWFSFLTEYPAVAHELLSKMAKNSKKKRKCKFSFQRFPFLFDIFS